jgi:hypothetical protein
MEHIEFRLSPQGGVSVYTDPSLRAQFMLRNRDDVGF